MFYLKSSIFLLKSAGKPPPPPTIFGIPLPDFYHRFVYIASSSDHSLLTLNLPFKVILRKFEVVFWCLEWEWWTFQKIYKNSFKLTNTITLTFGKPWNYNLRRKNVQSLIWFDFKNNSCINMLILAPFSSFRLLQNKITLYKIEKLIIWWDRQTKRKIEEKVKMKDILVKYMGR